MTRAFDGMSLLVDMWGCDRDKLEDPAFQHTFLLELPEKIGMHAISPPQIAKWDVPLAKAKEDWGYSGTILFAESHAYYHGWSEKEYLLFDLTSCNRFDVPKILAILDMGFHPKEMTFKVVRRGDPKDKLVSYDYVP